MMPANKLTIAVAIALCVSPFIAPDAFALSAKYREQLDKSGCTQVTDSNGTCDIHKTKAQNEALLSKNPVIHERKKIGQFLHDSVIGKSTDDAYEALNQYGFNNPEPLAWIKGNNKVILDLNSTGIVIAATLY